jgi:hypothetical protein
MLMALILMVSATACMDDTDNRQFATDPRTPQPTPTEELAEPMGATPAAPAQPLGSPQALVDRRGAPEAVYTIVDGALWAVNESGIAAVTRAPLASASSPNGHHVAVLRARDDSDAIDIEIYTPDGELEQAIETVLDLPAQATPSDGAVGEGAISLTWAPQGGRLLLAHADGQLVDITLEGTVEPIETRSSITGVVQARWSPRGDQIGVVIRDAAGYGRLALIDPTDEPASVNVIAPVGEVSGEAASVESFGWKPYGDGVLFLQGNPVAGGVRNGQIVSWDEASNTTQVVATGGQAGPSGSIRQFSVAPDGRAVAYTIDIATQDGWEFSGLYVRSLSHTQLYEVSLNPEMAVIAFWWLGDGLAWTSVESGAGTPVVIAAQWIDGLGNQRTLGRIRIAPESAPLATPVAATPGVSPLATPVVATTVGTPVATPAPSPPATPGQGGEADQATPVR